ncbi:Protein phosphatase 2C 1 [Pelomyxa schiedti]|nr:Protein phosphatase 2C 1 [Pelomyxa schiedti]
MQAVTHLDAGACATRGNRRTMEDAHVVLSPLDETVPNASLFCVFDGHGGKTAAEFCAANFPKMLVATGMVVSNPEEALKSVHLAMDKRLEEAGITFAGATAVCALIVKGAEGRTLTISNVGDAQALLCRAGDAQQLSFLHRPSEKEEADRIIAQGGFISNDRVNGTIEITRSIGDLHMKSFLSAEPFIHRRQIQPGDNYLVLSCDGVADFLTPAEMRSILGAEPHIDAAVKQMVRQALLNGSNDNVTCLLIAL